jgi:hypothetical protein
MNAAEVLADAFGRVRDAVHRAVEPCTPDQLTYRVDPEANSVAWLAWHLARIQDDHVAGVAGTEQRWTANGWAERFGLPFETDATGYGHSSEEVAAVRVPAGSLLLDYYDDVHAATLAFVRGIADVDLDQVVDRSWDPPVTLGVRLVSVISDNLQHAGQAAIVSGFARRR